MNLIPTSTLTAHRPVRRLSRCWVVILTCEMASKQPWSQAGGLCNLGKAAGARQPHANPRRRPPRWAIRAAVVKMWPRDHQCCSYSVPASSELSRPCVKANRGHFEHTVNNYSKLRNVMHCSKASCLQSDKFIVTYYVRKVKRRMWRHRAARCLWRHYRHTGIRQALVDKRRSMLEHYYSCQCRILSHQRHIESAQHIKRIRKNFLSIH